VLRASCSPLAIELDGIENVWAIAADTDGSDGTEDNAGAILTPRKRSPARAAGGFGCEGDASRRTTATDSFPALGDLVVTGPTRTNVNDYRAILIA
jgi:hydroxypyruvate reductase